MEDTEYKFDQVSVIRKMIEVFCICRQQTLQKWGNKILFQIVSVFSYDDTYAIIETYYKLFFVFNEKLHNISKVN